MRAAESIHTVTVLCMYQTTEQKLPQVKSVEPTDGYAAGKVASRILPLFVLLKKINKRHQTRPLNEKKPETCGELSWLQSLKDSDLDRS